MNGELDFLKDTECPICLETTGCVTQPKCEHLACIPCLRQSYYGNHDDEPAFPYPDIEDEYYDDIDSEKWENEYPLIKEHNEAWNRWDDERVAKIEGCCPVCRL